MYDEIMIPTDGSRGAHSAVTEGLGLAREHDAMVHVLYVNRTETPEQDRSSHKPSMEGDTPESVVDEVTAEAERAGVPVERHVEVGTPGDAILEFADENEIDAIVIGKHGQTGLKRVLLGSVAEKVVYLAPTTVITVPFDDEEKRRKNADTHQCLNCQNRFQTTADETEAVQCPYCGSEDVQSVGIG